MHERTQRAVARLLFVFCCAVPSSIVLAMVLVSWTPWYQSHKLAELTYELGRETGLVFQVGRCDRIAPGKYVLEDVRVTDPDSRRLVATIRMVDYFHGEQHVAIVFHQPEIQSAGLGQVWGMLHDRLIRRPSHTVLPIRIAATDANIISSTGSLPLPDVSASIVPEDESVRMIARAVDTAHHNGPQIHLNLFRDRSGDAPATELVLSTKGTAFRCSALAEYSPAIRSLGPDAVFTGSISCKQEHGGWSFDFGGSTLTNVNLDALTSELPNRVVGRADVRFIRAEIDPGETVNLVGTMTTPKATSIRLKSPLLAGLRDHLAMRVDESEILADANGLECKLSVHFDIRDQTLKLTGVNNSVALLARGRAIAWTNPEPIDSDQVTALLSPPSRWLAAWNQVFLPSSPASSIQASPSAQFRNVRNINGPASIRQQ